jgi:membrane-associated phospholipid phosphatase
LDWERVAQAFMLHHGPLRTVFDTVYASLYWPMLIGALVVLWRRDHRRFVILRDGMAISGAVGLLVFALYPVAPPRMLDGYVDTVSANARQHFIAHPSSLVNPYAALPSFHAGWVALSALLLALSARRWIIRAVALIPAPLMAVTVVVTANHYVVDVLAGIVLSLLGAVVAAWLHRDRVAPPPRRRPARRPIAVPQLADLAPPRRTPSPT